jgi:hypothetical protein
MTTMIADFTASFRYQGKPDAEYALHDSRVQIPPVVHISADSGVLASSGHAAFRVDQLNGAAAFRSRQRRARDV